MAIFENNAELIMLFVQKSDNSCLHHYQKCIEASGGEVAAIAGDRLDVDASTG